MANVAYWSGSWVGDGFDPGVEHSWWMGPIDYAQSINVTAQADHGVLEQEEREVILKDVRADVDFEGNRRLYFTVRNTGRTNIPSYTINYGLISP